LVKCPYFTTNLLEMNQTLTRLYHQLDSFVIYICIEGKSTIKDNKGNTLSLHQGESLLIPADTNAVELIPSTYTKILETYVE
ncbi:MAG: mannose-6-phosphate isomerase, partial [Dysgonamonadaceae bacterium]|nr:mannose-6-phosphate isomerase [Dysgonamonadaceae bacterium]